MYLKLFQIYRHLIPYTFKNLIFNNKIHLFSRNSSNEQEIFMYDISNGSVNKLSGELSTAFVKVAEENSSTENLENASLYEGEIMEEKKSEQ